MLLMVSTLLLATVATVEIFLKIALPRTVYLIVLPIYIVEALCISKITKRSKYLQMTFLILLTVIVHVVPWTHRKVFLVAFNKIEPGMTESQVRDILSEFTLLDAKGNFLSYRPSLDSEFDSDVGFIYFENGKVSRTKFSPD